MRNLRKHLLQICAASLVAAILFGCKQNVINPAQETYTYSVKSKSYVQPAAVDGWAEKSALTTDTKDGEFYCLMNSDSRKNQILSKTMLP